MLKEGRFPSLHQKRRLEELIKRMRSEAPEDRPSLSDGPGSAQETALNNIVTVLGLVGGAPGPRETVRDTARRRFIGGERVPRFS